MLDSLTPLLASPLAMGILLFVVGVLAGTINVVAGGGSFLTLPVLILLGLPAGVANGTNRVGILCQNAGAAWTFRRSGRLDGVRASREVGAAVVGSLLGVWLALQVGDVSFRRILAVLMIVVFLGTLWRRPSTGPNEVSLTAGGGALQWGSLPTAMAFFLVGIYTGFIQAGAGFFVLMVTTALGLDLVVGNAVKVILILSITIPSLLIFAMNGRVDWLWGLCLAGGTLIGGQIGVRLTLTRGEAWIRSFLTVAAVLFAIGLWVKG
ncbi:MAG: TSUP family transporter [Thermoanaerobaculia bacterium]|nr:TSUP family transporter [Thermoanaerobaculia bacterium]